MTAIPEDVKDEPPSDPLVWLVLADDGPLCVGNIVEATGGTPAARDRWLIPG